MITPLSSSAWNYDFAAHLAQRAGFGETPERISELSAAGPERAVASFLDGIPASVSPPLCADPAILQPWIDARNNAASPEEKKSANQELAKHQKNQFVELTHWWTDRMVHTGTPLVEKMTLFWHGHFATSGEKVRSPYFMWKQNETFRTLGLGRFQSLVEAISRDPAMLIWLDLANSRKEKPNENFARELLELFTLGEGHYSENDVKAAARAFTGYRVDHLHYAFRFAPNQFDQENKVFLGHEGPLTGDDVISTIVAQPQCAEFIASKIWRYFVYDAPSQELITDLANGFREHRLDLKSLLRRIFLSSEFYSERAMSASIKSPAQFLVQASRTAHLDLPAGQTLQNIYTQLGQTLFYPPNVKGWDGGKSWINTATLAYRYKLARQLVYGIQNRIPVQTSSVGGEMGSLNASAAMVEKPAGTPAKSPAMIVQIIAPWSIEKLVPVEVRAQPQRLVDQLYRIFFQKQPTAGLTEQFTAFVQSRPAPLADKDVRELVTLMMASPNYQIC